MAQAHTEPQADVEAALEHARAVAAIYWDAERALLNVVAERIVARLGEGEWEGPRFAELRQLRKEADRIVRRLERLSDKLVTVGVTSAWRRGMDRAVTDMGKLGSKKGISPGQGVAELAAQSVRLVASLHAGAITSAEHMFRSIVAEVAGRQVAGAETRRQATSRALNKFARKGITGYTDSSGRSWPIGSYAEMAMRTATTQARVDGHLATLRANDVDLVMVSRLPFTCEACARWEGKILTQSGQIGFRKEPSAIDETKTVDVLVEGTVAQARAAGLLHPQCGHNLSGFIPGMTRHIPPLKHTATYGDSQKMRRLERDLRAAKRQAAVALDGKERGAAENRVKELTEQLKEHAKESGVPRRRDREKVDAPPPNLDKLSDEQMSSLFGEFGNDDEALARLTQEMERRDSDRKRDEARQVADAVAVLPDDFGDVSDSQVLELVERFKDHPGLERLLDELDRRERATESGWTWRDEETEQDRQVTELIGSGVDELEAYAQVYGLNAGQLRRQEGRAHVESQRLPGESADDVARRLYDEWLEISMVAAERATRGVMVNREGRAKKIDPRTLLSGPQARARKYASDEMKTWWERHPRMTFVEFRAQLLGRDSDQRRARRTREERR